jgi:phosphatidylserine decarboxylase
MLPPANLKEVQRLAGHLVALSRLIAKFAERILPFFKTLRGSEPFSWTPNCQAAFEVLKAQLSHLKQIADAILTWVKHLKRSNPAH